MVSIDKIEKGLANYLDNEFMPQLKGNGIEKVIVGTAASLFIHKTGAIIEGYKDNKIVKMLGIMNSEGDVDVDTLVKEVKKNIPKEGFSIEIPIVGTLTFHEEDIDKLYDYIV